MAQAPPRVELPKFDDYRILYEIISDAYAGLVDRVRLNDVLGSYKSVMANPCEPPPNHQSMQKLEAHVKDASFRELIKKVSKKLNLDEVESWKLTLAADERIRTGFRDPQKKKELLIKQAESIYMLRRRYLLVALEMLIGSCMSESLDSELEKDIEESVKMLLRGGLVKNLIRLIRSLLPRCRGDTKIQLVGQADTQPIDLLDHEIWTATHILLFLFRSQKLDLRTIPEDEEVEIVLLLRELKQMEANGDNSWRAMLSRARAMLFLALTAALDYNFLARQRRGEQKSGVAHLSKKTEQLQMYLRGWERGDPYEHLYELLFDLYLKRLAGSGEHSVINGGRKPLMPGKADQFATLTREILDAKWFHCLRWDLKIEICEVICELVKNTIVWYDEELKKLLDFRRVEFADLLVLITKVCTECPNCKIMLRWPPRTMPEKPSTMTATRRPFDDFIRNIETWSELKVPYLRLLASLCTRKAPQIQEEKSRYPRAKEEDSGFQSGCKFVYETLGDDWSKYCDSLRSTDLFRHRPDEFKAILELIQAVVRDPVIQEMTMAGQVRKPNPQVLFWLLSKQGLNRYHKAVVYDTIGALLYKNKRMTLVMWKEIVLSQLLQPAPRAKRAGHALAGIGRRSAVDTLDMQPALLPKGLVLEITEVESKERRYPVTISYCNLLHAVIVSHPILVDQVPIWAGYGIGPHLLFLFDHVLLRDHVLGPPDGKKETEQDQWRMAKGALSVLVKVLKDFHPRVTRCEPLDHPGSLVMYRLGSDKEFFEVLTNLVVTGYKKLSKASETSRTDSVSIEQTVQLCLHLFDLALQKEDDFRQLLLSRPQSGKATRRVWELILESSRDSDVVMTITQCVELDDAHKLSFHAARVLNVLATRAEQDVVAIIQRSSDAEGRRHRLCMAFAYRFRDNSPTVSLRLREGEEADEEADGTDWPEKCKIQLVQILLNSLLVPNADAELAHLLLGFQSDSELDPDQSRVDRYTCLDDLLEMTLKHGFAQKSPTLAEACFELYYRLYAHPRISAAFAGFLERRQGQERKMDADDIGRRQDSWQSPVLFRLLDSLGRHTHSSETLHQHAWLLKTIALDMYSSRRRGVSSHSIRDTLIRLGFFPADGEPVLGNSRMKLLEMLDLLNVNIAEPQRLPPTIGGIPKARFRRQVAPGLVDWDVRLVQRLANQANPRDPEIARKIVERAEAWNRMAHLLYASSQAVEGWRQLAEVALNEGAMPNQYSQGDTSKFDSTLYPLLSGVLQKMRSSDHVWQYRPTGKALSSVALTVMQKIWVRSKADPNGSVASLASRQQVVLDEVSEAVLRSKYHIARANLYAVFFNYMQYVKTHSSQLPQGDVKEVGWGALAIQGRGRQRAAVFDQELLYAKHLESIQRVGQGLIEMACRDAMSGQMRVRAMAMVFVSTLLHYDEQAQKRQMLTRRPGMAKTTMSKPESLLHMLTRKGYLQRFVVELLHPKREAFLKEAINSVQMRHYEQIITYEILASLLTKVALREEGSLALLRLNVVSRLRECSFLGSYPEPSFRELSAMHMSPSTRYYQLFISTFQLVSCMLTSQPTNALLRRQAATLLDAHSTTLEKILDEARLILSSDTRQRHFAPSTSDQNVAAALQAAQLITGLVATLETSRGGGGLAKDLSHHYNALVQKMSRNVRDLMKSDRMLLERNGPDKNILLMYEITRNVMLVLASRTSRLGKVARGKENVGIVGGHNVGNMDVKVNQTVPWDMKVEGTDDNDGTLKLDDLVAMLKSIRQLNRQGYTGDRDMQMFGLHRLSEQIVEMTLQLIASHFQRGKDQQQRHRDLRKQLDEISTSYKGKFIQAMVRRIKKNPSMYSYE